MTIIATKYPFAGSIDTRQGGREENQDNAGYVDTPLGLLLVVCDGMGGGAGGRTASLMAVETILSVLADVSGHSSREDALRFAIERANDVIYAKAKDIPELCGMGTTVTAMLINENSAVVAHAGDTRFYQLRKGTIVFRSSDHSVVANYVRQKRLTEEEARNHPQSNIVTRALGIRPIIEIEFDEVTFQRGDRFIICTDGIWGAMPQRDLVKSLSRTMGIGELTAKMTEEIDQKGKEAGGGHDNMTLAILDAPFDSTAKKIKSKTNIENSYKVNNGHKYSCYKLGIMLSAIIIPIIFLLIYFYYDKNDNQHDENEPLTGQTITTVRHDTVREPIEDSFTTTLPNETKPQTQYHDICLNRNDRTPFNTRLSINGKHNKEITKQINTVVKNLDSLKNIKGKSKKEAEKSKQKYVDKTIKPNVDNLGRKVVHKKKDIKSILKMLKDRKTVLSSKDGKDTKDGNEHIDKIKEKIKKLQD